MVSSVSAERFARLGRGINLSHWFAQAPGYDQAHLRSYIGGDDVRLLAASGCGHLRFTLNPAILFDWPAHERLNPVMLAEVDRALDLILGAGLAAIVDLHPEDDFKRRLESSDADTAAFATFWRALAGHLAERDPELVFLEVLNEPLLRDAERWAAIQDHLLAAMRAGAPEHTLIATGHKWSSVKDLLELRPSADPNIIYNFHCYDPHIFTHQAATWGEDFWPHLGELPYPSSPAAVAQLLPAIADERARQKAAEYGEERWDVAALDRLIARAADWGRAHGVRLTCNEFGVYRRKARPEHRLAWLRDLRTILEAHGIGWTMWDYAGGFSLVGEQDGRRTIDAGTAAALGLMI
jgi:endoglucanase